MDALPLRHAILTTTQYQRSNIPRSGQSQTTIDLYLRPIAKTKQSQNDIRKYFPPVAKLKLSSNGEFSKPRSPPKTPASPKPSHDDGDPATSQTPGPRPSLKSPAESIERIRESRKYEYRVPGAFVRLGNHNHARSAVLPRFDPYLDCQDFPHSTSPMAPRVTDVVRHSLVPKPLNIKMPPYTVEASRSPSQTTSSPSSVEDLDTASLDEERGEAPSFKQTYLSVHSRHHTNDSPVSPLTALRDSSAKPMRQHMDRPATLRSNTAPKRLEPYPTDSVIYFLPKISPTSDSSADERAPLIKTSYPKPMDKASIRDMSKAKGRAVKLENVSPAQIARKKDALKEREVTVSPGMETSSAIRLRISTEVYRTPTLLRISCISKGYSFY